MRKPRRSVFLSSKERLSPYPFDARCCCPSVPGCHSVTQALYLKTADGRWSVHYVATHSIVHPPERGVDFKRNFKHLSPTYAIRLGMVPTGSGFAMCTSRRGDKETEETRAASRLYILGEKPLLHQYMLQNVGSILAREIEARVRQLFDKASMSTYLNAFIKLNARELPLESLPDQSDRLGYLFVGELNH